MGYGVPVLTVAFGQMIDILEQRNPIPSWLYQPRFPLLRRSRGLHTATLCRCPDKGAGPIVGVAHLATFRKELHLRGQ